MYDLVALRCEFPVLSGCVYLDSASTSQTPHCAVEEMNRFMTNPTPEQAEQAMNNMEAIASQYWASHGK